MGRGKATPDRSGALSLRVPAPSALPLTRLSYTSGARNLGAVANMARHGELILDPSYQRGSVWTNDQRVALVRSILSGIPIGAVFLNTRSDPAEPHRVVDGRQRIEAIRDFVAGQVRFPAEWIAPADIAGAPDAEGLICFTDLALPRQRVIRMSSQIAVYETALETEDEERQLFELINFSGTPMAPAAEPADPPSA